MASGENKGFGSRLSGIFLTSAVTLLLGGLVSALVVGAVVFLSPPEEEETPVAIVQGGRTEAEPEPAPAPEPPRPKPPAPPKAPPSTDKDGYIRRWLILAPIPCEKGASGSQEIGREQIPNESKARPEAGRKEKTREGELTWVEHVPTAAHLDFKAIVGKGRSDLAIGYAACTIMSAAGRKDLRLQMRSNDQGAVWLNGKRLLRFTGTRTLETGEDEAKSVRLRKGANVLLFKVINEYNNWQGSVRFLDAKGKPYRDFEVSLEPR